MQFPIQTDITPLQYGRKSATVLKIDGNAGQIPPAFQYAILADDGSLCEQGVNTLTQAQWDKWGTGDDQNYILSAVAQNLGLTQIDPQ